MNLTDDISIFLESNNEIDSKITPNKDDKMDLFNVLRALLANYYQTHIQQPTDVDLPMLGLDELLQILSTLQYECYTRITKNVFPEHPEDVRTQITKSLNTDKQKTLALIDQDTIDIIALLFDFLHTDSHIPSVLKKLIMPLQIPLLKVALLDKTFFTEHLHPVRSLLDNIAQAAAGWSDDGDYSSNSLYGHIATTVQQTVKEFKVNLYIFHELNEKFSTYLQQEQLQAEITEQRTTEVTRSKEHLWQAKKQVANEIASRLKCETIPLVVRTLIKEGWKDVLLLTYLRYGPQSQQWRQHLTVADQLVWSVQPKINTEQRQKLLRLIPDLLRQLLEGLNDISYDQYRITRLIDELQECHIDCLRIKDSSQSRLPQSEQFQPTSMNNTLTLPHCNIDQPDVQQIDQTIQLVKNLQIGTWLEITQENKSQIRVKLSWKSEINDIYVFVNRKGIKVLEMTTIGVVKLLHNKQAMLLHNIEIPVMERAINSILVNLGILPQYSARHLNTP